MPTNVITGNDTFTINKRVLQDFATDDVSIVDIPNKLVDTKTGKNGNTIFAKNNTGYNSKATLKVLRGSPDDQFLLGLLNAIANQDFAAAVLVNGTFVKRIGDGLGNVRNSSYTLSAGMVEQIPGAKDNAAGDTDQATITYNIMFAYTSLGIL